MPTSNSIGSTGSVLSNLPFLFSDISFRTAIRRLIKKEVVQFFEEFGIFIELASVGYFGEPGIFV
jgi:hypothetical protein